jgi:2-amino-4-hydroxy-6-hydroxymethyldihydropteridine diphosphokinase
MQPDRPVDGGLTGVVLPEWSVVTEKRRAHIGRVTALLDQWSLDLGLSAGEQQAWRDAGLWHDALRDADEVTLRAMTGDADRPYGMLHGPAAALRLAADGEARHDVLEAIRWHTVGNASWGRTGRALFMADFLEPGRTFMQADRAFLADRVPSAFDAVFRQVVRLRLEWTVREGKGLAHETVTLWNAVR